MPITKIAYILEKHFIPYYIKNNMIFADTMEAFSKPLQMVENLTGYTEKQLKTWLGY